MSLASGHKPVNMPSYLSLFRPDVLLKNSAKGYFCSKIQSSLKGQALEFYFHSDASVHRFNRIAGLAKRNPSNSTVHL